MEPAHTPPSPAPTAPASTRERHRGQRTADGIDEDRGLRTAEGNLNLWTAMLENAGGYWVGPVSGYQAAEDPYPGLQQTQLSGGGAYEGLSALLYHRGEGGLDVLAGLVFTGEFPPLPQALDLSEK